LDNAFVDKKNNKTIAMCHTLTWSGVKPYPDFTGCSALTLLRKMKDFSAILVGDNHKSFTTEDKGRILISTGSMMRQTADQIDFKPRVYLWYADTNTVEPIFLPISDNVISREHIDRQEIRDGRISAFISRLDDDWKAELSFEDNLERFFAANEINDTVKDIIYKAIA